MTASEFGALFLTTAALLPDTVVLTLVVQLHAALFFLSPLPLLDLAHSRNDAANQVNDEAQNLVVDQEDDDHHQQERHKPEFTSKHDINMCSRTTKIKATFAIPSL